MFKFGGTSSIIAGLLFAISGIVFLFAQVGQFDWDSISSISIYFTSNPSAYSLWKIVNIGSAVAAFLAIASVLALMDLIIPTQKEIVRWASILAIIGYAVIAITNIADLYQIKRLALGYAGVDEAAKSVLEVVGIGSLDPTLNIRFMTIGIWLFVVGWVSMSAQLLPKTLAYFGVVAGLVSLSFAFGSFFDWQSFTLLSGIVAVIFHPVWLIWIGIQLRQVNL